MPLLPRYRRRHTGDDHRTHAAIIPCCPIGCLKQLAEKHAVTGLLHREAWNQNMRSHHCRALAEALKHASRLHKQSITTETPKHREERTKHAYSSFTCRVSLRASRCLCASVVHLFLPPPPQPPFANEKDEDRQRQRPGEDQLDRPPRR